MIELTRDDQRRLAARIATRRRCGPGKRSLGCLCVDMAERGWAPDQIAERFGRSSIWAMQKLNEYGLDNDLGL